MGFHTNEDENLYHQGLVQEIKSCKSACLCYNSDKLA